MTREVRWSRRALQDFARQIGFIARDSELNAERVADRLERTATALGFRHAGRPARMAGMFEKSVDRTSLVLAYDMTETSIEILRIIHSAQNWTRRSWPEDSDI